jgi:hypothetical protein
MFAPVDYVLAIITAGALAASIVFFVKTYKLKKDIRAAKGKLKRLINNGL